MKHVYPNLFIPGAAKSGTTTLHDLLNLHPDICMSTTKEPVFWNKEHKHPDRIAWYNSLFSEKDSKVLGESTTSYMYFPEFIEAIKTNFNFSPKFIFILRNPIDRCYSHYWYLVGRGQEKKSFEDSMNYDMQREYKNYGHLPNYYYHFGLYGKWLTRFYKNFNPNDIKIITLENLIFNKNETLNECLDFLKLERLDNFPNVASNKSHKLSHPKLYHFTSKTTSGKYWYTRFAKYILSKKQIDFVKQKLKTSSLINKKKMFNYPKITEEKRLWLKSIYAEDVKTLKKLTGNKFSEWKDFN